MKTNARSKLQQQSTPATARTGFPERARLWGGQIILLLLALTVTLCRAQDATPPQVESVINAGSATAIEVVFSELVEPASATNSGNYQFQGGAVSITGATLGNDGRTVLLATSPVSFGASYTLLVSNVRDRAATPNTIAANTPATFTAVEYTPVNLGRTAEGSTVAVPGGFDMTAQGRDIGGTGGDFHFAYQEKTGDFDIQLRVLDLVITEPWVQAGLLARDGLATNSPFAGVFTSSAELGAFFEFRRTTGTASSQMGPTNGFPVNYPWMYLRLTRSGDDFRGYGGFDGTNWQQLGEATIALSSNLMVGMAAASHQTNQATVARFRELKNVSNPGSFTYFPEKEAIGPSNRRTGLIFSEIMHHPSARLDGSNVEFVEIYNAESVFINLDGWRLNGAVQYEFPAGTQIQAGQFLVVALDPQAVQRAYGITGVLGPYSGSLRNPEEPLFLLNKAGAVRLEVEYGDNPPWPASADGAGHSLILARPSYGEDDPRAWGASTMIGGSPGQVDPIVANPWGGVVINEFLANPAGQAPEFVELYNASNTRVDISGCFLSDDATERRFRIPDGTTIEARGFLQFTGPQLGFGLSSEGETIYLVSADGNRVLDAIRFEGQESGISTGRAPDGSPAARRLRTVTPEGPNSTWRSEQVVINELMFHPISEDDDDQYIELHNTAGAPVDVSGWQFTSGITFEIPEGTSIPGGGFLVVARNKAQLLQNHPNLNNGNTVGDYSGRLSRSGERLELSKRVFVQETNELGNTIQVPIYISVSEVTYYDGGRWGTYADGGGSSLELIDPRADTLRADNWQTSDETQKAPWTTVELSAINDNPHGGQAANRFFILMQGAGEALVDDVDITRPTGTNLLTNGDFEFPTGWVLAGNHSRSVITNSGAISGERVLYLRAPGDGDTWNNTVRANMRQSLAPNERVSLKAKVRWLAGWPEVLFRVRGNGVEFPVKMEVPKNLGTPGMVNSRRVQNAGPAIFDVVHTPALPRINEPVLVTARVSDPDGVVAPELIYRIDRTTTTNQVTMRDDGLEGDVLANDGVWSALLEGRATGALVAFRVYAQDDASPSVTTVYPAMESGEALIRWNDTIPFGTFEHHHLWNTQATEAAFNSGGGLNNTWREGTLVYGVNRVIYNVGFRHKGSPYHGGTGDIAATVPKDELLLGTDDRVYGSTGNGGPEGTAMKGDMANWIAEQLGLPFLHSHYIRLYRNGSQFQTILYDLEQPNRDMAQDWFGGGGVNDSLYKIAVWFEFDDGGGFQALGATLQRFLTEGQIDLGRYRWNWQIRPDTATANDYSGVFNLVNALATPADRTGTFPRVAHVEQWMRSFGWNRLIGNWDVYGMGYGQNMYMYAPLGQRAVMMPWDVDFVLGEGNGPNDPLWGNDSRIDVRINELYAIPEFRRMLWRFYIDAVNGPMVNTNYLPQVDARRNALLKNRVSAANPASINTFLTARRNYINQQLNAQNAKVFEITSNGGAGFTSESSTVQISGTAPFEVATIEVNGVPYPVTWTGFTTWRINVPLGAAANNLRFVGKDLRGNPLAGMEDSVTVTYTGAVPLPQDWIVINEIMYDAAIPDGDYVEIHNRHPTFSFNLSGMELAGVDFIFPEGTFIPANGYLLVVENSGAFAVGYGASLPVAGVYAGNLQNDGENLRLIIPATGAGEDVLIDEVRYDNRLPWPANAAGLGASIQLIDAEQDNARAGNWWATALNDANKVTPGGANAVRSSLPAFPLVWVNEVSPNNVTGSADNMGEREPWIELYNSGTTSVDLSGAFLSEDPENPAKWQFPAGARIEAGQFLVIWADGEPNESTATIWHANFRLNPTNGVVVLSRTQPQGPGAIDFVRYEMSLPDLGYGSVPDGDPRRRRILYVLTPGAQNDPTIPNIPVFINEWMASNNSFVRDPADQQFEDWFELHNAGSTPVDLSGYTLTDRRSNPAMFTIPAGFVIPAGGHRLVWADSEPEQNAPGRDLHTSFSLGADGEEIGLYTPEGGLVDLVEFAQQTANISQGRFPDAEAPPFFSFTSPSPGAANVAQFANQPPNIAFIEDRQVAEGELVSFNVQASDPDAGDVLTLSLVNAPPEAAVSPAGVFTWRPGEADGPGVYSITVRAQDNGTPSRSFSRTFRVAVTEQNTGPSISEIAPMTIDEGILFEFQIPAVDADLPGQQLNYTLIGNVPAGAAVDPGTGLFSWTPFEQQGPGVYNFTVQVTDPGQPPLSAMRDFRITVREINNAPIIVQASAGSAQEGEIFRYQVQAIDGDNPPARLVYSLVSPPNGAWIDQNSGMFTWLPTEEHGPRDYDIQVRVSEAGGGPSSTMNFLLGVAEVNTAPLLHPISSRVVSPGDHIEFVAKADDSDLPVQTLTFQSVNPLPPGAALNEETGHFTWTIPSDPALGTNEITIRVMDDGPPPMSMERTFQVVVRAPVRVVINEIMHRPAAPNTEFVELHNPSSVNSVDISGWRLEGYQYTFPASTVLQPMGYLVVAKNLAAFQAEHGNTVTALGNATVNVGANGGIVRLIRSRGQNLPEEIVDEVGFSLEAPWPAAAAQSGASLQLTDPWEDNRVPANWTASTGKLTNAPVNLKPIGGSWKYQQTFPGPGWMGPAFSDTVWPIANALFYVEDAQLPAPKNTPLTIGRNTYYFRTSFEFRGNPEGALMNLNLVLDDGAVFYLNGQEIARVGMAAGFVTDTTVANRTVGDASFELIERIPALGLTEGQNILAVEVHQSGPDSTDVVFGAAVEVLTISSATSTPGAANSLGADLETFPPVWINEVMPNNSAGAVDNNGEREPWIELHNAGNTEISLDGWHLTDSFGALTRWAFPNGVRIAPRGYLLVWADGEAGENAPNHLHTNFRLSPTAGTVALTRTQNQTPSVVDYANYSAGGANISFGSTFDGDPLSRQVLPSSTPGMGNRQVNANAPRISVNWNEQGLLELSFPTQNGFTYRVEGRASVTEPWETLDWVFGTGGTAVFSEPLVFQEPLKLFRVVVE